MFAVWHRTGAAAATTTARLARPPRIHRLVAAPPRRYQSSSSVPSAATYDAGRIEQKWQRVWARQQELFGTPVAPPAALATTAAAGAAGAGAGASAGAAAAKKPASYVLSMFPYPSGALHMGHVRVYTVSDVIARYQRACGYDVLHPIGFDSFGLPAENAALERGVDPAEWTFGNIKQMRVALQSLGLSFDWNRAVMTCVPEYYRWTQWLFCELFEAGAAYRKAAFVNWDPVDRTVLADEQVDENGRSWRSGALAERKLLNQWFVKITNFKRSLLDGLSALTAGGWPDLVVDAQRQWLGRSTGALVKFKLVAAPNANANGGGAPPPASPAVGEISVFTTRVDTLFGVTFIAIAPEHALLSDPNVRKEAVNSYKSNHDHMSVHQRLADCSGANTGVCAVHPLSGELIPIFVASYVLPEYATGAVMGVPAHDARDFKFAKEYALPIRTVIEAPTNTAAPPAATAAAATDATAACYSGPGVVVNSSSALNGKSSAEASAALIAELTARGLGSAHECWRLRDWLVSRQRYWGAPIPIIHCKSGCGPQPVPRAELPVRLPPNMRFSRTGTGSGSPLSGDTPEAREWRLNCKCPKCGGAGERETDTLDTFVDSSWYFLRYLSPDNDLALCPRDGAKQPLKSLPATNSTATAASTGQSLLPVAVYVGGAEHATTHLLYSRFITQFLHSRGVIPSPEPFHKLLTIGTVRGATYKHPVTGAYVPAHAVRHGTDAATNKPIAYTLIPAANGSSSEQQQLILAGPQWEKMSKSKSNGVEPSVVVHQFGADTARCLILSSVAHDKALDWQPRQLLASSQWLMSIWSLVQTHITRRRAAPAGAAPAAASAKHAGKLVSDLAGRTSTAISKTSSELSRHSFATALKAIQTLSTHLSSTPVLNGLAGSNEYDASVRVLLRLLAPFAPHIASELWMQLHDATAATAAGTTLATAAASNGDDIAAAADVHRQSWPVVASAATNDGKPRKFAIQLDGVVIGHIELDAPTAAKVNEQTAADLIAAAAKGDGAAGVTDVVNRLRAVTVKRVLVVVPRSSTATHTLINFVSA